jgi:alkylation response protein AidB-like acyl-CoA dehydrogenase
MEEFAWGDLGLTLNVMAPNLVAIPLMLAGSPEQQAQYLPASCEMRPPPMTAALTEPAVQFDPHSLHTTAIREGDKYVLNGVKTFVPLAGKADLILVYANDNGRTQGFLIPTSSGGLVIGERERWMGLNSLPTYRVTLKDVQLPAAARLGGEAGCDFHLLLNHSRVALGAAAVGVARAGFEYARDYAKERVQFGEPIAHRQSIAFMLADMATDVDEMRMMVWEAAWLLDQGRDATCEAAVMKQHIDRLVLNVADRAVQILGGYGYIREYPVELWLRNARGFASFDGLAMV